MALSPVEFPRFGGLDLRVDPQDLGVGGAVDASNVLVGDGRLASRNGVGLRLPVADITGVFRWPWPAAGADRLVVVTTTDIYVYRLDDFSLLGSSATTETFRDLVVVGASSADAYLACEGGPVRKLTSAGVLTAPAGMPSGDFLAVQSPGNRLVVGTSGGFPGQARIRFSDPGAFETFQPNNFVDLEPNDDDELTAIVSWNNQTFVFKNNKFYVFYGNSVDGDGEPVFNYRRVSAEIGAVGTGFDDAKSAVAAVDGVYFVHRTGVYRTTGGAPTKLSGPVDPLFTKARAITPYYTGAAGDSFNPQAIIKVGSLLVIRVSNAENNLLAFDTDAGTWTAWSNPDWLSMLAARTNESGSLAERLLVAGPNIEGIGVMAPDYTTDCGDPIMGRYRPGFLNPGAPGAETDVFEWLIDGTGTITMRTAINDGITLGAPATIPLGTAPQVAQGRDGRAVWGRNIGVEISGAAPWSVSRIIANVTSQTDPGFKT